MVSCCMCGSEGMAARGLTRRRSPRGTTGNCRRAGANARQRGADTLRSAPGRAGRMYLDDGADVRQPQRPATRAGSSDVATTPAFTPRTAPTAKPLAAGSITSIATSSSPATSTIRSADGTKPGAACALPTPRDPIRPRREGPRPSGRGPFPVRTRRPNSSGRGPGCPGWRSSWYSARRRSCGFPATRLCCSHR